MVLAILLLIITIVALVSLLVLEIKRKVAMIVILSIIAVSTFGLCVVRPIIHKPFSISVIDYILKFNTDGSVTTIKQTTTTQIKETEK